jgi:ComF family protein
MRKYSQSCIDAVFPTRCWQCEQMYLRNRGRPTATENGRDEVQAYGKLMADYLCPQCAKLYAPVRSPLCLKCGRPYATRHGVDHKCPDCLKHSFGFDEARAVGLFDQSLKTIIHQYKYQGRTELVRPLGHMLWAALHRFYDLKAFDIIVPVPLHWFRQYRRGFNQATLLVRQWARLADEQGISFNSAMISEKVLIRRRHTLSQTGLGKQRRIENLKNAFVVRNRKAVIDQHILLIDDVMTTGATTNACAITLKRTGASSVKVLTVARAA